jgi:hypothetical protein
VLEGDHDRNGPAVQIPKEKWRMDEKSIGVIGVRTPFKVRESASYRRRAIQHTVKLDGVNVCACQHTDDRVAHLGRITRGSAFPPNANS